MRVMERNKRTMWLSKPTRKQLLDDNGYRTGEYINTWSEPVEYRVNVSAPSGDASSSPFGTNETYDLTLIDDNNKLDIAEGDRMWFSKEQPNVKDVNNCYEVKRVSPSLLFCSFGLTKVNGR